LGSSRSVLKQLLETAAILPSVLLTRIVSTDIVPSRPGLALGFGSMAIVVCVVFDVVALVLDWQSTESLDALTNAIVDILPAAQVVPSLPFSTMIARWR
jgi:hypothetical protein